MGLMFDRHRNDPKCLWNEEGGEATLSIGVSVQQGVLVGLIEGGETK